MNNHAERDRSSKTSASTSTESGNEVPAEREEHGNAWSDLGKNLETIWTSAPEGVDPKGWTELALKSAERVGKHGRLYKKHLSLSTTAAKVAWKEENSSPGILSITEHWYQNAEGEPRRDETEMRVGWGVTEAVELCGRMGIDVDVAVSVAKAVATTTAQRTSTSSTSTSAQVQAALSHYTTSTCTSYIWEEDSYRPSLTGSGWSPLTPSTGIESSKGADSHALTAKIDTLLSSTRVVNGVSNKSHTAPQPPVIVRRALQRQTCERSTIEAIYEHVPEAKDDKVLFRWIVYALWTRWRDKTTHRRVIHHRVMDWIGARRFDSAKAVLQYIRKHLDVEFSNTWSEGDFTRQILDDGLPPELWKAVQMDLDTPPSEYDTRVYILSGRVVTHKDAARIRKELREEIKNMEAPSPTAHRIWKRMNDLPPNRFDRFQDKISEALEYVDRMEIDVSISPLQKARLRGYTGCEKDDDTGELSGNVARYKARVRYEKRKLAEEQRREYKQILHRIAQQHKPFYKFSRQEHTDRIFPHNDSALLLPSEVREILCAGLYDVDLKSAHLLIAAWLWDAEAALEQLTKEEYSIWDDLMAHCQPLFEEQGLEVPEKGDPLYDEVKAGMKIMVYSTVYGMPAPSIQAEVTKSLQHVLGPDVGAHLREHKVIVSILQKRDEVLADLEPGDTLETPSGIEVEVEVGLENEGEEDCEHLVGPKSAVATQAQAYEQELMSVLLDVADERDRTRLVLWLHDGAACQARHPNALETDVNEALDAKRRELTEFAGKDTLLPALFEVEKIEKPEMPPKDVHDRIACASRGALRLKDGEAAVRVDEETGEELGPAGGQTLLKAEHALYKVASTYIRITDDGYSIESDPFPEEKLWQKLDSSTSSTSSKETTSSSETTKETNQNPKDPNSNPDWNQNQESQPETAPGAESPSSEEESSPGSDTSTTGARPASRDEAGPRSTDPRSAAAKETNSLSQQKKAHLAEKHREWQFAEDTPEPDLKGAESKRGAAEPKPGAAEDKMCTAEVHGGMATADEVNLA